MQVWDVPLSLHASLKNIQVFIYWAASQMHD